MQVPQDVIDWIQKRYHILVIGHKDPDGDCVGSQMALSLFLGRVGKKPLPLSPGPFTSAEVRQFAPFFKTRFDEEELSFLEKVGIVVVDTSSPERTGPFRDLISRHPTLVIDHHSAGTPFGDLRWVEPSAPSTTFLVQLLIEAMAGHISQEEAFYLFYGLATDTGFFRFLEQGSGEAFRAASRLVDAGISPRTLSLAINGGQSFLSRRWIGMMLERMEPLCDGKFVILCETRADRERFSDEHRESDLLYHLVLDIEGCEALAALREEPNGRCKVSLRSKVFLDVGALAREFGGGGHVHAAGFETDLPLSEAKALIIERFLQFCK
ncbi:phosphoesterase RecJ domain protein [Spirochaeta thermophila DSM 6578]|uniref:Phosphoesterase RecJ domain protein n=1 Tax=Winmispira thermophila (strain ATCC 700085 / DSM 6578 / Z-1203) TaxID=869211 RepID=G0G9X7_WINT7|nr:bifunctional oligoribonuclease/PAP phosphatase NrnA [Spirochaeta thermophila]AEJ60877.1 phosphoesterase RecJ domain protein [Spirochaeta thermophila DSM 6578]